MKNFGTVGERYCPAQQKNVPEKKRELTNSSPCDKVVNNFYRGDPEDDKTR